MKQCLILCLVALLLTVSAVGCQFKEREESAATTTTTAEVGDTTTVWQGVTTTTYVPTTTTTFTPPTGDGPVGFVSFPARGYSTDSVNVRPDASTNYTAIGGLYYGEEVTVLGKEGDWYKISFNWTSGGEVKTHAYVNAQYISATPPPKTTAAPATTTEATEAETTTTAAVADETPEA